ncbi:hypothetical protein [Ekhidna sp.]|jgi:hypothetical protein|uniref:hypothetical protein n=1 Tax=Ekhidna sp. TaxID=2608089 RepID=UPI0032EB4CD7
MKRTIALFVFALCIAFIADAQRVKEKDIIGTWKLVIDIEEEMEEEAEDADSMLEEIFIKAVSGFVVGIMEDIEIYFEFQPDNDLKITVHAYDETETERGSWYINKRGYLVIEDIEDDDDDFHISSDDDEWKLIDGILVSDEHERDRNVYMTRVN